MESPRPVPPYLRLVVPSACRNGSKIMALLVLEMPIPVSMTSNEITRIGLAQHGVIGFPAGRAHDRASSDAALVRELERVREQVLENLLQPLADPSAWSSACRIHIHTEVELLFFRHMAEGADRLILQIADEAPARDRRPSYRDSIFDRSRMSLISASRSTPRGVDGFGELDLFALSLPSAFSASIWARISRLLSGVRSSCDMFARNSLL